MLVHKINFKVHGTTFNNEDNINIQEGIVKILNEYKRHDFFDSLYGGYTKKEIIEMNLNVSEYEDSLFSGSLKEDYFNGELCYKVFIDTYTNEKFHIGYVPKNLIKEVNEFINKDDLKCITNISVVGGKCKHCVVKEENYEDIETVEIETLNYGFEVELRFCNNEITTNNNDEKQKNINQSYTIIDKNTVKIKNKKFTKEQIKKYRDLFLVLGIIFILLGIMIFPIMLLGLLFIFMYNNYNKIYKELNK